MFAKGSPRSVTPWFRKREHFLVRCSPKAAPGASLPAFKKGTILGEVFAEGSLPERHTLVLKKGPFFGEVFAEGSLPERHSQVLR